MRISESGFWVDDDSGTGRPYGWPPDLARWIAEYLADEKDEPVHDFGCGLGGFLRTLANAGFTNLTGYEGSPPEGSLFPITKQDITVPFTVARPGNTICLEVAEHIPAHLQDALLDNIARATKTGGRLVSSWAIRGQTGVGHVSELDNFEAIARIEAHGFRLLEKPTRHARTTVDFGDCHWFRNTLLIFQKDAR